ncbi:MAG: NAD-dependent epimerase/dehydratase family protein, partial [Prevotella pallens]|nr:NAD-dependent epimerase/dehydratase family protein [Prevotella pallens]
MNAILEQDIELFAQQFALKDELRKKTIAITGATGLLGACMVRCLLKLNSQQNLGLRILAVVRNIAKAEVMFGKQNDVLGFYTYDFSKNEIFNPTEKIDFIVHFASPTASKYFVEYPVETMVTVFNGTKKLLDYARTNEIQSVLLASSLEVYGTITNDSKPLTEDAQGFLNPMDVRSSYPMAKRAAETLC